MENWLTLILFISSCRIAQRITYRLHECPRAFPFEAWNRLIFWGLSPEGHLPRKWGVISRDIALINKVLSLGTRDKTFDLIHGVLSPGNNSPFLGCYFCEIKTSFIVVYRNGDNCFDWYIYGVNCFNLRGVISRRL